MKKVTIYTLADKRPDFIEPQFESFKKHIKDNYEYVVLNNAISNKKNRDEITRICKKLDIRMIHVIKDKRFNNIDGEKAITFWGSYTNANLACAYPLNWAWEQICEDNKDNIFIIIDSDMFICKDISFNKEMEGCDASFIIQYRGPHNHRKEMTVTYPWNGICIFDTEKIQNIQSLSWDCGEVKGFKVDVGGGSHFWLEKNKIKIRHISEYAIHNVSEVDQSKIKIEAVLNGNYHYHFVYDTKDKSLSDFYCYEHEWEPEDQILPQYPDNFLETLQKKTLVYYEKFIKNKQTYPNPTFLGLIEFENFKDEIDPFIIHNKAGSGYAGFPKEYGIKKLEFIKKTLSL